MTDSMATQGSGDADRQVQLDALRTAATEARDAAWCPYSGYPVGAALEADDGRIFVGCNVENAAYPAGICAERSALAAAIVGGARAFRRIAIVTAATHPTSPCGVCRQALVEFAPALEVMSFAADGTTAHWSLADLLPAPFTPASLEHA